MIGATGDVEVSHEATVHAFLDCEVDDGLLLAVLNTSDASLVRLLVVELHVLDDVNRNVFQSRLHIAKHELLAVKQNFLHHLAIDGDVAVFVNFGSRNTLDKLFDGRALRRTIRIGIIYQCIFLHDDLCRTSRNHHLLQHISLGSHQQVAQFLTAVVAQRHLALYRLVTHRRHLQPVDAVRRSLDGEVTLHVGDRTPHEGRIPLAEQLHRGLHHRLFQVGILHIATDRQSPVVAFRLSQRTE